MIAAILLLVWSIVFPDPLVRALSCNAIGVCDDESGLCVLKCQRR